MKRALSSALLSGIALALLAPALAGAEGAAPGCVMSCCRVAPATVPGMTGMQGMAPARPADPPCDSPCGMRRGAAPPSLATLAGLPPTVMPAALPLAPAIVAAPIGRIAARFPNSLSLDLPDRPPRA